jgi:hypothetical protein
MPDEAEALRNIIRGSDLADREDVSIRMSLAAALRKFSRSPARGGDHWATTALGLQSGSASAAGVPR